MAKKNSGNSSAPANTGAELTPKSTAQMLIDKYGVDVIYENSKGEFFLNKNLALASEGGKLDNVNTHNKE